MRKLLAILAATATLTLSGCGYNTMQTQDEDVKGKWAEVVNQYQRQADLINNLVKTVEGETDFEKSTLEAVVNARASATGINATPELINDPAAFAKFNAAQSQMQSSLSRLLVVAENYPNLKANQAFSDLRVEVSGSQNRIAIARKKYIDAVQTYNTTLRTFPNSLTAKVMGYDVKPSFTVDNEADIAKPPTIEFKKQ